MRASLSTGFGIAVHLIVDTEGKSSAQNPSSVLARWMSSAVAPAATILYAGTSDAVDALSPNLSTFSVRGTEITDQAHNPTTASR
jgi:hypothetical protein